MYGSHSTVTVCHSNPHCHYISAHCYQYVRQPQYSYCMPFESSLLLYQCTLLPICTVATAQLLYAIRILTVTISVHTVTNMYGSHSTVTVWHSNPHCHYISAQLPICTVATAVKAICQKCGTVLPEMPILSHSLRFVVTWLKSNFKT